MKDILSPAGLELLRRLARTDLLLAFDYDGTLAPLVEPLDDVRLLPSTRGLLGELALRYPCAVITGRGREDVLARIEGIELHAVVGNHGIEFDVTDEENPAVAQWIPVLERELAAVKGIVPERKRFSITVHYADCEDRERAREAILAAAKGLENVRVISGKQLVNIVPADAPHKGDALLRAMRDLGCDHAIYVGDDLTDEDAFALDDRERIIAIRVDESDTTKASHILKAQSDIDDFLRVMIRMRESSQ